LFQYFTDVDGYLTKGCIDIIPEYAEIDPPECSDFYKKGFCVRGVGVTHSHVLELSRQNMQAS